MKATINQQKAILSLDEAIEVIDKYRISILVNASRTGIGDSTKFAFDTIRVEEEILIFGQEYGEKNIFLPVSDIDPDIFFEEGCDRIELSLTNGDTWIVSLRA